MSEQELLACVMGRGIKGRSVIVTAHALLGAFGSLRGLAQASFEQLSAVKGVGASKAAQLLAATEIARRMLQIEPHERACIDSDAAAATALQPFLAGRNKEHFVALFLDTRNRLIRTGAIAVGTLSATLVHPRELFREAVAASSAAVIVAHNHPSGDPEPSADDVALTRRLDEAGKLLGIPVVDHIIIGEGKHVSLRARGVLGDASWPRARRRQVE